MPFLLPPLALIAGILIGDSISLPAWGILPILAGCLVYLFLLKDSSAPLKALKNNKRHNIWIVLIFLGIGIIDMGFQMPETIPSHSLKRYVNAEGEIVESKSFASGDQFVVKIKSCCLR